MHDIAHRFPLAGCCAILTPPLVRNSAPTRMPRIASGAAPRALLPLLASACTTFGSVRSASVSPGVSFDVAASVSTPPGDAAAWFWSWDCVDVCDHPVVGGDVGATYGWRPESGLSHAVSAGWNGEYPYVDGYLQLSSGERPFGIGVRGGLPVTSWREHQLYARYDVPLGARARLLVDPAILLHEGASPNGEVRGHFLGLVQGLGVQVEGERLSWTPAVSIVAGRAQREGYGTRRGPVWRLFGTASFGVNLHRASRRATSTKPDGR